MKYQVNSIIKVKVTAIEPYGAFVTVDDDYKGLIHISEINGRFIKNINEYFSVGDVIFAKIIGINEDNKQISLTLKDVKNELHNKNGILDETDLGFTLLADLLPKWINEKLEEIQKKQ